MNILNWPHWQIVNMLASDYDYQITAFQIAEPACCLHCGECCKIREEGQHRSGLK